MLAKDIAFAAAADGASAAAGRAANASLSADIYAYRAVVSPDTVEDASAAVAASATAGAHGWREISNDATSLWSGLEAGRDPSYVVPELAMTPLWHEHWPAGFRKAWNDLESNLLARNEDWEVWTDWYDARLKGGPSNADLERARVLISDEDWEQGPAHVNAIIKRLIEEHEPSLVDPNSVLTEVRAGDSDVLSSEPTRPMAKETKARATKILKSQPDSIAAQIFDLHDRVEEELSRRRDERRNHPDADENIVFLEKVQTKLSELSDSAENLLSNPSDGDAEAVVDETWNVLDLLEQYCVWIAGRENARTLANGVLLSGFALLGIQFGFSPAPVTTGLVAALAGTRMKPQLIKIFEKFTKNQKTDGHSGAGPKE